MSDEPVTPKKKRGPYKKRAPKVEEPYYGPQVHVTGRYENGQRFDFVCHEYRREGRVYILKTLDGGCQITREIVDFKEIEVREPIPRAGTVVTQSFASAYTVPTPVAFTSAPPEGAPRFTTSLRPTNAEGQLMTEEELISRAAQSGRGVAVGMMDDRN